MVSTNPDSFSVKTTFLPALSLFSSMGTLVCCALPALLVTLGAGATLAGLVSSLPWLVALSKYKAWVFSVSALMLVIAGISSWRAKRLACPTDPQQLAACKRLRKASFWILLFSVILWVVGFFFAYIAVHVFY